MITFMTEGIRIVPDRVYKKRKAIYGSQQNLVNEWNQRYGDAPHQTHLSGVEKGEKGLSVDRLGKLAILLETNVDFLVGNSDDDKPASDLEDQVVFSVRSDEEREALNIVGSEFLAMTDEDQQLVLDLVNRLSGKKPRLIE